MFQLIIYYLEFYDWFFIGFLFSLICNQETKMDVYHLRDGIVEVDYVVMNRLVGIEVKSKKMTKNTGLVVFKEHYKPYNSIVVGRGGVPEEEYFYSDLKCFFER